MRWSGRANAPRLAFALLAVALVACGGPTATPSTASDSMAAATAAVTTSPTTLATAAATVAEPTATAPAPPTAESTATAAAGAPPAVAPTNVGATPRDARTTQLAPLPLATGARTVVIDPGHGADEIGAAAFGVVEKQSNLELAFRVERLLAAQGVRVLLTRRDDVRAFSGPAIAGFSAQRRDLQARVDLANEKRADVFVSLHSNGSTSGAERGAEVYYNAARLHSDLNRTLAQLLLDGVIAEVRAAGFEAGNRGAKDDSCLRAFQGRCFPLFLLGPERVTTRDEVLRRAGDPEALGFTAGQDAIRSRATQMPAALVELFFVSNAQDAALLRSDDAREAMARGVARGVLDFLAAYPR
ncbi:MAG: N-acetylmuramoyl-L-alanine amidase [Dehalococcoidia bacterium]|nr:N-acetylmuramoyl-L-alanine amidase [Dehalococcoidia bacterium]